jgi:hypothetical protein
MGAALDYFSSRVINLGPGMQLSPALDYQQAQAGLAPWAAKFNKQSTETRFASWAIPLVVIIGGGAVIGAAAAAGAVEAGVGSAAVVEGSSTIVAAETLAPSATEFSLAGTGQGVGIGGQSYGLGLQIPAAAPGAVVSEFSLAGGLTGYGLSGNAAILAPSVVSGGVSVAELVKQAQAIKSVVSPALALGRAVRSLLGDDSPGGAESRGVTFLPADEASFGSDALWTVGTLAAALALVFGLSKS